MGNDLSDRSGDRATSAERLLTTLFPLLSFFGAFLLFQVQPIVSKLSLPYYGGAAAVWNTAMMFFQGMLLLGYALAHHLNSHCELKTQIRVYLSLMAFGVFFAFGSPAFGWQQPVSEWPIASLVLSLGFHVGISFLALSITAPLLQSWFVRVFPDRSPYLLYAASNGGSLLALLSYPFLIEPLVGLAAQQRLWALLYLAAWLIVALLGVKVAEVSQTPAQERAAGVEADEQPSVRIRALWLLYSAISSVILLGATSVLCYDVAPMPLFLVVPLAIYLLTFVLCFGNRQIYVRPIYYALFIVHAIGYSTGALGAGELHVLYSSCFILVLLYASCMVCNGELYRLRPSSSALTSFYLHLSFGGFIGSVFAAMIAPQLFTSGYHELSIALAVLAILYSGAMLSDGKPVFPGFPRRLDRLTVGALPILVVALMYWHFGRTKSNILHYSRSFYGILKVFDVWEPSLHSTTRHLVNGQIRHGSQLLDPGRKTTPISYYGEHGGMGVVVQALRARGPLRVGVIGLGAGASMGYAKNGDYFRIYELNPDVVPVAKGLFSYLAVGDEGPQAAVDSRPRYQIVEGDGRLALAGEPPQQFDLLLIDAFTSDAIPTHLLTVEAVELYFKHLKPDGILLFHISNRHLDLVPVVSRIARKLELSHRFLRHDGSPVGSGELPSNYAALSKDAVLLQSVRSPIPPPAGEQTGESASSGPLWTDDFTSLFGVLSFIPPWESVAVSLGLRPRTPPPQRR